VTVKALIALLKDFPKDAVVQCSDDEDMEPFTVDGAHLGVACDDVGTPICWLDITSFWDQ
jgi:hypothetical protein